MSENTAYIPLSDLREFKTLTRSQITRLEALDTDGTGYLRIENILQVLENDHKKESQKTFFNKLILLLLVSGVILVGALCGITYGIVATTNEINVDNGDHVLRTSPHGGVAGLGAAIKSASAESVLSTMKPWGIRRLSFVNEDTGQYGCVSVNAIQVSDLGTVVRSILGDEFIVDETGRLAAYNRTNGRKLLSWNDVVGTYEKFEEAIIDPIGTEGKAASMSPSGVSGISLDRLFSNLKQGDNDAVSLSVHALLEMLASISIQMASCIQDFSITNLDCYSFLPCFDFMLMNVEVSLNSCAGQAKKQQYCTTYGIYSIMAIYKDTILNFLKSIAPTISQCVLGDTKACTDISSILDSGENIRGAGFANAMARIHRCMQICDFC